MNDSFFSNIDLQQVATCYYDWSMIAADFEAPVSNVLEILPTEKLKPLQIKTGITRVTLMAMAYRQIDNLTPYNEFGVGIPVASLEKDHHPGTPIYFISHLPVTTQQACDGGVIYYGFPKFVAQISFDQEGETTRSTVNAEGQEIILLEVGSLSTTYQALDFCTYSVKDDKLLKTLIQVEGQSGMTENQPGANYILGTHPYGAELSGLEMSQNSVRSQYAPKLQSILHLPEEIMSL